MRGVSNVSNCDEDLTIRREALTAAGCSKIDPEKITGAKSDRPQLARLVKARAWGRPDHSAGSARPVHS